ncbi:MAG: KTSC domain-containing protein [Chthoniobacterales bacterium]|nr:KTSC domain-containing protein [Chthoniobacterales bacterium]
MKIPHSLLLCVLLVCGGRLAHSRPAAEEDEVVSRIKREAVVSTNVASVGYSEHLHALEIEFSRGATYRFLDVPHSIYRGLMKTSSKGHFINENIRGHYRFVHVRSPGRAQSARAITSK